MASHRLQHFTTAVSKQLSLAFQQQPTCRKRASSMRAPMRRFISSSFFSLSSNVEGSMLGNSLSATCGRGGGGWGAK